MVEAAIVLPILFMFILGMVLIGMGIFRYQQVAQLAREGARYASVHGSQYASESGNSATSASGVYNNAIQPKAIGLDTSAITYQIKWGTAVSGSVQWTDWDSSSKAPTSANPNSTPAGSPKTNLVSVTVSYSWSPYIYRAGILNLSSTSTSVMPMAY